MKNLLQNAEQKQALQSELITWFHVNKRALPWRQDNDWYSVFLSEFLLQQTQVAQALPYFNKLLRLYPTVVHLAAASEDELLKHWAGLGYYSRARNLRKAAQAIVSRFNGRFPTTFSDALSLPGIGPYTAAAILSIAFNKPHAVVDGNVMRVVSRLFNITDDIRQTKTQKAIRAIVQQLLPHQSPGIFNEAIMELGALICLPSTPHCNRCPLQHHCLARQMDATDNVPFKSSGAPKKHWYHFVLVLVHEGRFLFVKRPAPGLLAGMWEFPSLQTDVRQFRKKFPDALIEHLIRFNKEPTAPFSWPSLRHIYSHIILHYKAVLIPLRRPIVYDRTFYVQQKWLYLNELSNIGLHQAHKKILNHPQFKEWWQKQNR